VWREPYPRRGEETDGGEGCIGESVPSRKVSCWVEGRRKENIKPFQEGLRVEDLILEMHREAAGSFVALVGPPVDQLSFGDREGNINWGGLWLK